MIPFWSLFTGLLWLGFLIAVGIAILAYRSYKNFQPLRQGAIDACARVEVAIRDRAADINQLSAFLVRRGGWQSPSPVSVGGVLAVFRDSSRLLTRMHDFVDRLPELKESPEYRELNRRIQLSSVDVWQRIESYQVARSNYELSRASFPALLFASSADQPHAELLDLGALRSLRADAISSAEEQEGAEGRTLFYVLPGGVPKGPISEKDLKSLIDAGVIPQDAMIAEANSKEWRRISS